MNTATMDLPEIDPALIDEPARTAVAAPTSQALELAKVDIHDLVRAQFKELSEKAAAAKKELSTVVLDLSTQTKIDEAKSLRERRINKPIAEVRKLGKGQRSGLSQAGKTSSSTEERIVGEFTEAGATMTTQIEAAQKVIDDKKAADKLAEETRLAGLRATVDQIMQKWLDRAMEDGITAERIGAGMAMLTDLAMPAELADVFAHWNAAHTATIAAMTKLQLDKLLADKAERYREDADIDCINDMANDCVARKFLEVRDRLAEFDTLLMPSVSPAARVQAVAAAARERIVALMETAREDGDIADIVATEAHCLLGASASLIEVCLADFDNDLTPSLSQAQRVQTAATAARARIVALLEAAQQAEEAAKNSTELAPTGEGKAGTPGTCNAEAAPIMCTAGRGVPPVFSESDAFGVIAIDAAAPDFIQSNNFVADTKLGGWRINSDGTAEFNAPNSEGQPADAGPVGGYVYGPATPGGPVGCIFGVGGSLETSEADAIEPPAGRVILLEPEPEDDTQALLEMSLDLVKHARAAFNGTRWPTQPKPGPSWWDALKQAAEALEPKLQAAIEAREVA